MLKKAVLLFLVALPFLSTAFVGQGLPRSSVSKTSLSIGPLQRLTNKKDYEKTITGLMQAKGYTREQAEKEYNAYLDNPTNYALNKGEAYYKSLGYKTLMEGVRMSMWCKNIVSVFFKLCWRSKKFLFSNEKLSLYDKGCGRSRERRKGRRSEGAD